MSLLAAFRRPGILLLLPLLLALAARLIVAPGWMLESDSAGSITVRICSDPGNPGGTITIALESAGDHDIGAAQQHCPWGALAHAPVITDGPMLVAVAVAADQVAVGARSLGFAPGVASPLPPSTGPPILA